jgi:hypothetical protein
MWYLGDDDPKNVKDELLIVEKPSSEPLQVEAVEVPSLSCRSNRLSNLIS